MTDEYKIQVGESVSASSAFAMAKVKVDGEEREVYSIVPIPDAGWTIVLNYVHHLQQVCVCSCGRVDVP